MSESLSVQCPECNNETNVLVSVGINAPSGYYQKECGSCGSLIPIYVESGVPSVEVMDRPGPYIHDQ